MATRRRLADYRRDFGTPCNLGIACFLIEHGVVTLNYRTIKSPRHALAHMGRRCGGYLVGQTRLLVSKLPCRGNGLVGRSGHVEQHFAQMGATRRTANSSVNGFAPARTQFAANQQVHALGCFVAFRMRNVSHVGKHLVNDELVVNREANAQAMNGLSRFARALAWNHEVVGFDVSERSFYVPHTVFPFKAGIDHGACV